MYIFLVMCWVFPQYFPTCNNYLLNFIYKQRIKQKNTFAFPLNNYKKSVDNKLIFINIFSSYLLFWNVT